MQRKIIEKTESLASLLQRSYVYLDLWWMLRGPTRSDHIDTMRIYSGLFPYLEEALFSAFIVQFCAVHDRSECDVTFKSVLVECERQSLLKDDALKEIQDQLGEIDPIIQRIRKLRNKHYAHREHLVPSNEMFQKVGLKPDEIHLATEKSFQIANCLSLQVGGREHHRWRPPRDDLKRMLQNLSAFETIGSEMD